MYCRRLASAASVVILALATAGCASGVLELQVGTCFDQPQDLAAVTDVPVVNCDDPHDNEVIGFVEVARSSFPGAEVIGDLAFVRCVLALEAYAGVDYADSPLDVGWIGPTEESWDIGDREIICFAFDARGDKLAGSVAADRF